MGGRYASDLDQAVDRRADPICAKAPMQAEVSDNHRSRSVPLRCDASARESVAQEGLHDLSCQWIPLGAVSRRDHDVLPTPGREGPPIPS